MYRHVLLSAASLMLAASSPAALTESPVQRDALALAEREGRIVMVECTGSDWCRACMHLRHQILDSPEFDAAMGDRVVLVTEDYPRAPERVKQIPPREIKRREELLTAYGIRSLPAVILLDAEGLPFGLIQGTRNSTAEYLAEVKSALAIKAQRDAAFIRAEGLDGMARASALASALSLLPEICRDKYGKVIDEIRTLDPEDTLGYASLADLEKRRVEQSEALRQLLTGFQNRLKPEELQEDSGRLDDFLQRENLLPEIRQKALMAKADIYALLRDVPTMHRLYKQALEIAPESEAAGKLREQIKYVEERVLPRLKQTDENLRR